MADAGIVTVVVEGKDVGLVQLIQKVKSEMAGGVTAAQQYSNSVGSISNSQKKAEATFLSWASSMAKTQQATGKTSQSILTLSSALNQTTPGTTAFNNAQLQLQRILNQTGSTVNTTSNQIGTVGQQFSAQAQGMNTLSGASQNLTRSLNALGGVYAVIRGAKFVGELIEQGNQLEKTEAITRALAGSTEAYNHIVDLAKERQAKFGGSLEENLDGLSNFANLSKRTGADIDELSNAAQRLAAIDPAQIVPIYSNV